MGILKKHQVKELEFSELIAKEVTKKVSQWVTDKTAITQSDLDRKIVAEVRKYNKDLAFILGERNKII